jgi:hypothetical protein
LFFAVGSDVDEDLLNNILFSFRFHKNAVLLRITNSPGIGHDMPDLFSKSFWQQIPVV